MSERRKCETFSTEGIPVETGHAPSFLARFHSDGYDSDMEENFWKQLKRPFFAVAPIGSRDGCTRNQSERLKCLW